jgi:hypothetical protein
MRPEIQLPVAASVLAISPGMLLACLPHIKIAIYPLIL